jgi:hypothetical protein
MRFLPTRVIANPGPGACVAGHDACRVDSHAPCITVGVGDPIGLAQ